jgi:hypothetical protein
MWQLFLERLMSGVQRQAVKQGVRGVGLGLIGGLNKPEAYADRIDREFNLRNYAEAWNLYDSNRAYWEKLYGDDPLTSLNHPASPSKSLLPHQPSAIVSGYNLLNPAAPGASAFGPFGTDGQFAAGSATSSWPLYETQSLVPPPIGSTSPDATGDDKPERHLGVRIGDRRGSAVFDVRAPAVPFASPNPIPLPGRPATFDQRFEASSSLAPNGASSDDLGGFRRQWLKTFMEP